MAAHRELESLCLDRQTRYHKRYSAPSLTRSSSMTAIGSRRLREALDAFFTKTQEFVTGSITLGLYKGNVSVKSRTSPCSLYQAGHRFVRHRKLQPPRR